MLRYSFCYDNLFKQGIHGVEQPVFLSVPCVVGENGITDIIQQTLTEGERNQLQKSAATLNEVQINLVLWNMYKNIINSKCH